MQKIFYIDKIVYLCKSEEIKDNLEAINVHPHISKKQISEVVTDFLQNPDKKELHIYSTSYKKLLKDFISHFNIMKSAGGLVINDKGQFLVIKRKAKWDLPKGKCEKGEEHPETALREVSEECGLNIKKLRILTQLKPTYHTISPKENPFLKKTYWYVMHYSGNEPMLPAIEENITEVCWFNICDFGIFSQNTWPSLLDVVSQIGSILTKASFNNL